jgi:phenylalanyl-tRNA synthetase alpha chain
MSVVSSSNTEIARALALRDLTDPCEGPHAIQRIVDDAIEGLCRAWRCERLIARGARIVSIADNYDALGYESDAVTRDARYTRYVTETEMLRSHTTALVPAALRTVAASAIDDVLIACPGVVYRRDAIDRLHSGTPHQLDLWRVVRNGTLTTGDLKEMIEIVMRSILPGAEWRVEPRVHPYTTDGLQIDVDNGGEWVEIGECGLAAPAVLSGAGLPRDCAGLALGVGLDRLLMLRKGMADIRLLRASDPRIAAQMRDLSLYRTVSNRPAVMRDLSIAVEPELDEELLGDRVREALDEDAEYVEAVAVVSQTRGRDLPAPAAIRLGLRPGQKNVLLRVTLRSVERTLTREEANNLRDRIFTALHQGRAEG